MYFLLIFNIIILEDVMENNKIKLLEDKDLDNLRIPGIKH
jgi:hypothetical protein